MNESKAEIIRKQYLYRSMIMKGQLKADIQTAKKMIGPDCAYHLYSPCCRPHDSPHEGGSRVASYDWGRWRYTCRQNITLKSTNAREKLE